MPLLLPPREAYDLWADTYPATAHNPLMEVEQSVVARLLTQVEAARALDVGTGSGRYLPILAATGASVVGIDLSMAMLSHVGDDAETVAEADATPAKEPRGRRHIVCADAYRLPFRRGTFDLVNASLMVGDVADLAGWMREASRVLTARGHLVYSDFHPSWRQNGWQRTFRDAGGVLHAVAFEPHAINDHLAAIDQAGMQVQVIREPRLKIARRDTPVVVIFHLTKEGGPGR